MVHQRFRDLPRSLYPLTVALEDPDRPRGAEPLWHAIVTGPGTLEVPVAGRPCRTRVVYGDGSAECIEPTGERRTYRRMRITHPRSGVVSLQLVDLVRPARAVGRVVEPGLFGVVDEEQVFAALEGELEPSSFVCPTCRRISFHPTDVEHRYCAACRRFTGDPTP